MTLLTPANLQRLSSWPHLVNTWYLVTAAALCATNRSAEIPTLYTYVIQKSNSEDRRQLTTRMREALFKTAPLVGLPRAINALTALANVTSAENRDTAAGRPVIESWEARMEEIDRGKSHWNTTYGKVAQRVQEQMVYAGGSDLWTYVLEHVYAPVLSYEGILECGESALVVIGTLAATGADGAGPQLKGHFIGAVRGAGGGGRGAALGRVGVARRHVTLPHSVICQRQYEKAADSVESHELKHSSCTFSLLQSLGQRSI